jgi:T5orf172 domain
MRKHSVGFVYVLSNESMPGIVKVGKTTLLTEDRAKALFSTGVPPPFDIEYRAMTSLPTDVERRSHNLLAPWRLRGNREFFKVTPEQAADAVREAHLSAAGINYWFLNTDMTYVDRGDRITLPLQLGQYLLRLTLPALMAASWEITDIWLMGSDHAKPGRGLVTGRRRTTADGGCLASAASEAQEAEADNREKGRSRLPRVRPARCRQLRSGRGRTLRWRLPAKGA